MLLKDHRQARVFRSLVQLHQVSLHGFSLIQESAVPLSRDNLVINELIREYLLFNGYRNTLSVLLPGADLAF